MNPSNRTSESLETENARLRARVKELESRGSSDRETRGYRRRRARSETEDRISDIPSHAADVADRMARGITYAIVEHMQAGADALDAFANEIFRSSTPQRRTRYEGSSYRRRSENTVSSTEDDDYSTSDRAVDNVSSFASGIAEGIHESLEIPRRTFERFHDAFNEDDEPRGSSDTETHYRAREIKSGGRVRTETKETHRSTPNRTETKTESETERQP